ncbi:MULTISPECIES: hypothetical protein [unclassified Streptomyces]|nr:MULTISPECIES: hypothetical protein [unclassified Streptomyces]
MPDLTVDQAEAFTRCARTIEKSVREHSRQQSDGQSGAPGPAG